MRTGREAMGTRLWSLTASLAALCLLTACTPKKKEPIDAYSNPDDQAIIGESDLGGGVGEVYDDGYVYDEYADGVTPGSSLDEYRQGTLGQGEYGPLDDIYFTYDSHQLSDRAEEVLSLNSEWLRANPAIRIEVEGHCDERGTVEYNLALGARRATSVRDFVVSLGIPADRVTTISYGKELPVCSDDSEGCWSENRRAHFVIIG